MDEHKSGKFRKKKTSFAQVSNIALRDSTLSLKAKGLLALIESYLSLDNFTLYKDFLISKSKDGETAFRGAWKELKDHGYLIQYKIRDSSTNYFKYEYEICDNPQVENQHVENNNIELPPSFPLVENPLVENVNDGVPTSAKHTQLNNTLCNNNLLINTIRTNIAYDSVFVGSSDKQIVDNIVDIIADVLQGESKTYVINGNKINDDNVKTMFKKISTSHIYYAVHAIESCTTPIKNLRNYVISILYNAVLTLDIHYTNLINT